MATSFDRWEKDPFFSAAEEVQESADRMESVYRQWIQEKKSASNPTNGMKFYPAELRQDLRTALGTAKWQLEELDRAVRSNDDAFSAGEATRSRHSDFVMAIGDRISMVENSLRESNIEDGDAALSWVKLDEGERDELAMFLSGTYPVAGKLSVVPLVSKIEVENNVQQSSGGVSINCSKNSCNSNESSSQEMKEQRVNGHGHRRTASATPDIGGWKISVSSEDTSLRSSDEQPIRPPPRILSFSGLSSAETASKKTKWYRNGFRKWKGGQQHNVDETIPLRNQQLSREINACYEKSKSCLSSCDESYDKQLDGWLGVIQRQLQRSQYQIQYGRPIQMIVWAFLAVLLIVLFLFRSR